MNKQTKESFLEMLFRRLRGERIVSESHDKTKAVIRYSIDLTVDEYERLERTLNERLKK